MAYKVKLILSEGEIVPLPHCNLMDSYMVYLMFITPIAKVEHAFPPTLPIKGMSTSESAKNMRDEAINRFFTKLASKNQVKVITRYPYTLPLKYRKH